MGDEQKNSDNKLFELIKQHPKAAKWTGGVGGFFLLLLTNNITGFVEVIDFNDIIEWIKKLKSLIHDDYSLIVAVGIIAICICKKMDNNVKVQISAMKLFCKISKSGRPIFGFNLKNKKGDTNILINIEQSDEVEPPKKNDNSKKKRHNDNIINFSLPTKNDMEVEE